MGHQQPSAWQCFAVGLHFLALIHLVSGALDTYTIPQHTTVSNPLTVTTNCECDLTSATCDGNCCCDSDCSTAEKALFQTCLSEGPSAPTLDYCVPTSTVAKVNLPSSSSLAVVSTTEAANDFASALLCIESDRNPDLSAYFTDPPAGTAAALTTALASSNSTFYRTPTAMQGGSLYKVGQAIPALYVSTISTPVPGGYWAGNGPVFSRDCDALNMVGFMLDIPPTPQDSSLVCQRSIAAGGLAALCTTTSYLSPHLPIDLLQLAATPTTTPSIPIKLTRLQTLASATGVLTDSAPGTLAPVTATNAAAGCDNVLTGLNYTVYHDGAGAITAVEAGIIVTTVASFTTGTYTLSQSFSATWIKANTQGDARPKSGNPGYLTGYPLLAGYQQTQASGTKVVARLMAGLPLPLAAPDGSCLAAYSTPVRFGRNTLSTCSLSFATPTALQTFCTTAATSGIVPQSFQLMNGLLSTSTILPYIGTWANADALTISQWTPLVIDAVDTSSTTWTASTATCKNVPAGLQFSFLTSQTGSGDNPQMQVSYAKVSFIYADWSFRDQLSFSAQKFPLQHVVRFVPMAQADAQRVRKGAPPLYPSFPQDIFYPFLSNSASSRAAPAILISACVLIAGFVMATL